MDVAAYLRLARPVDWLKNAFVPLGLLFAEAWLLALPASLLGWALAQMLLAALGGWLPPGAGSLLQAWGPSPLLLWLPAAAWLLASLATALPAWRAWRLDVLTLLNRS